jgi:membrane-associated HD superfamily phosphohydrolase
MANKYHRQSFSKGKLVTETVKKAREAFKNIYKTNKKKENVVDQLNKNLKKQRKIPPSFSEQEPYNLDVYTDVMVSDFDKKTGPYFDRLKKLKGKK